tara:strand:+ start:746 stop:979 length:234 start_codon:yes stop_codon:yes gene_type:complete
MVKSNDVVTAIMGLIPDAKVSVEDLSGTGDHLQVNVESPSFKGLSLIQQHQMVYKSLAKEMATEAIHALALNTSIPD